MSATIFILTIVSKFFSGHRSIILESKIVPKLHAKEKQTKNINWHKRIGKILMMSRVKMEYKTDEEEWSTSFHLIL